MLVQPDVSICTVVGEEAGPVVQMLRAVSAMGDLVEAEAVVAAPSMPAHAMDRLEKDFPRVKWVETRPGNRAFLRNQALQVATGRYLAFWEPAWEMTESCLRTLVDFMDEIPDAGLAAPRLCGADGRGRVTARAFPGLATILAHCLGLQPFRPELFSSPSSMPENVKPIEVDWLVGDVLLVRREALDEVGGFGETFFWLEELEWCLRIRRAGWHIHFIGAARVGAMAGGDGKQRWKSGETKKGGAEASALFRFLLRKWFGYGAFGLTRR